jgi:transposase
VTCVQCGLIKPENRPKFDENGNPIQDKFKCVGCGYEDNADKNASRAIALKGIWTYIKKEDKIRQEIVSFQSFLNKKLNKKVIAL